MKRLATYQVGRQITRPRLRGLSRVCFGVACAFAMIACRMVIDWMAPAAGPYALIYPTVLLATLYGCVEAGIAALLLSFLWTWWIVLPPFASFGFESDTERHRALINFLSAAVVVGFAEVFRRMGDEAMAGRNREIERSKMLHMELEHRTRNNFALVISLLAFQRRSTQSSEVIANIDQAMSRVQSFALAYANLEVDRETAVVEMAVYLHELIANVAPAALPECVAIETSFHKCELPREQAVAIGLFANEAITNAAKHAYNGRDHGKIAITFSCKDRCWRLTVADDGPGESTGSGDNGGKLGSRLFSAFAAQAEAEFEIKAEQAGRTLSLWGGC